MITVTVSTLDDEIKEKLRTALMRKLLRKNGSLPLSNENDKIIEIVEDSQAKEHLTGIITDYYKGMSERDVNVELSPQEYAGIYFHYV